MKRRSLTTAMLPAFLVLGSVASHAQEPPTSPPPSPPATKAPEPSPTPTPPSAKPSTSVTFPSQQSAEQHRSSKIIGQPVYSEAGERIGDVKELIVGNNGQVDAVVIGVGGFLGLGEKFVAVTFNDLKMKEEANGSMRLTLNSTKEALETAPEYKYADERRG